MCGWSSLFESPLLNSIFGMLLWFSIIKELLPLSWFANNSWWSIVWLSAGICFLVLQKILLVRFEEETGLDHSNQLCGCKKAALNNE